MVSMKGAGAATACQGWSWMGGLQQTMWSNFPWSSDTWVLSLPLLPHAGIMLGPWEGLGSEENVTLTHTPQLVVTDMRSITWETPAPLFQGRSREMRTLSKVMYLASHRARIQTQGKLPPKATCFNFSHITVSKIMEYFLKD